MKVTIVEAPVVKPPRTFNIELTEDEALILTKVLGSNKFGELGLSLYERLHINFNESYFSMRNPFEGIAKSKEGLYSTQSMAHYMRTGEIK